MVDPEDEEIKEDEEEDEFADYFKGCKDPKVLITTSKKAHSVCYPNNLYSPTLNFSGHV